MIKPVSITDFVNISVSGSQGNKRYQLGGSALAYLRHQANLPWPTTSLNDVSTYNEGEQWLCRGDRDCELVALRVYRYANDAYDWRRHVFALEVLYKRSTWQRLERREVRALGSCRGDVEPNGWKPIEEVLNEYADIIKHLLDVYQVAVIK